MVDAPNTAVLKQLSRINDKLDAGFSSLGGKLDQVVEGQAAHGEKLDRIANGQDRIVELLEEQIELMKPLDTKSPGWHGGPIDEGTDLGMIGPNGEKRPSDVSANAVLAARIATGEAKEEHVDAGRRQARRPRQGFQHDPGAAPRSRPHWPAGIRARR